MKPGILLSLILAWTPIAAGGGEVSWESEIAGLPMAITAGTGQVFVVGKVTEGSGQFFTAAYDAGTGQRLWQDQIDGDNADRASQAMAITHSNGLLFAVGSTNHDLAQDSAAFLVRTYDTNGNLNWESEVADGRINVATNVVADHERVFAGGLKSNLVSGLDFVIRTYHARSGRLLWEKDLGKAPERERNRRQLPSTQLPFCTVGDTLVAAGSPRLLAQAYDAHTGRPLWQVPYHRSGIRTTSLVASGGRVLAIGVGNEMSEPSIIWITAFRAADGRILWQKQYASPEADVRALHTTASTDTAYISGYLCRRPSALCELLVLAYDANTGALRWQDHYDAGLATLPSGVAAGMGLFFVGGVAQATSGAGGYFLRCYDAGTGRLEWSELSDQSSSPSGVAARSGRVFLSLFDPFSERGTLRAYRAR
ncbi:MAG: PQQ-binding-like beta-propeller repeat protein [Candidatus Polarisedimenticolia bacterium]